MSYGDFIASVEPTVLGLDSGTFSIDRKVYWSAPKDARRVLSSKYAVSAIASSYFDVEATFSLALQWSEADGPVTQPLKIECIFRGHFHADSPISEEHAKKFAESESWLIFWPFFRQFVSDTTARMAIPPLTIPLAVGPGERSYQRPQKAVAAPPKHPKRLLARKK